MANIEVFGLLAETFVHVGSGQSAGAIDLPVMRERTTNYPFIPGSSIKGALRDAAKGVESLDCKRLFGEQDNAGELLIGDARLVLLPVRSLSSPYRWVTCPLLLERLCRDLRRAGRDGVAAVPKVEKDKALAAEGSEYLYLEERQFTISDKPDDALEAALAELIPHEDTRTRLSRQLVILHNDDFAWFAEYALPVHARNVLDENKSSKNLWYEEALPPDTLLSLVVGGRGDGDAADLATFLRSGCYLQVGGNETVGQGWFAVQRLNGAGK